jgi:hypothetical protein
MNKESARELLRASRTDREEAREAVARGQAIIESAGLIIQGVLRAFPELAEEEQEFGELWDPEQTDRPLRSGEAILQILQLQEDEWVSVQEMVEGLDRRGWLPEGENPANAVRTALERLVASNPHVEKGKPYENGSVRYRFSDLPRPEIPAYPYTSDEEPF